MDTRTVRQQSSTCHTNIVRSIKACGLYTIKSLSVTENKVNNANQAKPASRKSSFSAWLSANSANIANGANGANVANGTNTARVISACVILR